LIDTAQNRKYGGSMQGFAVFIRISSIRAGMEQESGRQKAGCEACCLQLYKRGRGVNAE